MSANEPASLEEARSEPKASEVHKALLEQDDRRCEGE